MAENGKIFKLMANIIKDVSHLHKSNQNSQFAGIKSEDVNNMIHPIFAKYGVFMTSDIISSERFEKKTKNGILSISSVRVKYYFFADDGSFVCTESEGEAMDVTDKGITKAMSKASRDALINTFRIPTSDYADIKKAEFFGVDYEPISVKKKNNIEKLIEDNSINRIGFVNWLRRTYKILEIKDIPVSFHDEILKFLKERIEDSIKEKKEKGVKK
jgi:hypothetical protein